MNENPAAQEEHQLQDDPTEAVVRSVRRHSVRSGSRSRKKILQLKITVAGLLLLLFLVLVGWLITNARLSDISEKYYEYQASIRGDEATSEEMAARVRKLEEEKKELLENRIPGLQALEFDTTLAIDREYFRNIGFTLTGTAYAKNYEYKVVLENKSMNIVRPAVIIYLFDDRGIQVGEAELTIKDATSKVESEELQPDETRSYTGRVALNINSEPKYFLILMD